MNIAHKALAIAAISVAALSTLAFAPVPNTTVYHGNVLYAEDGSQVAAHVHGKKYEVAFMPASKYATYGEQKTHYYGSISILDAKGKIVFFRSMKMPKAVNAFGGYLEEGTHYRSLKQLKHVVAHEIAEAHPTY
jgi:hypothetical protein